MSHLQRNEMAYLLHSKKKVKSRLIKKLKRRMVNSKMDKNKGGFAIHE